MKFLESNSSIIAHEIYFEMIEWKHTIIALKSNITIEFADAIQYGDKATIDYYLDLILSELNLRFGDWKKLPLLWTALASSKIKQAKELALLLLIQL
jgi:hypothetical protein